MAKLRHIAIASDDPKTTAETLATIFDLEEVGGIDNELATGVFLSDGTMSIAVLKFHTDQGGRGLEYTGLHHVGFLVDDMAGTRDRLARAGIPCVMDVPEDHDGSFFETKFLTAEGFLFDVSAHPWVGSTPLDDE
jgi:catechol 2,3-dioxygenase-like lactoylglutathione lyase family enzyme